MNDQKSNFIMAINLKFPVFCLAAVLAAFIVSMIHPFDWPTWIMEVAPVLIAVPVLFLTYKRFRLTDLAYAMIAIHCIILIIGGHYSYARVPLFDWIRDILSAKRNSYDGVGHFAQGFVPALIARELLLRTSPLKWGKWMAAMIVLSCFGISAIYELLEWAAALAQGSGADEFLSTQGDPWDTQKDMALAGVGAIVAMIVLPRLHDRELKRLEQN